MQLTYLKHSEIDFEKWDASLANCTNKLIYAESVYLNTMAEEWDAIVNEDWTVIMPFPVKKKYGFTYIPTIPFVQQLGVFSIMQLSNADNESILVLLKQKFILADYNLNYWQLVNQLDFKNNYILSLKVAYDTLFSSFKNDLKKDLNKNHNLLVEKITDCKIAINLFFETYQSKMALLTQENKTRFTRLCNHYLKNERCFTYIIYNGDVVVASALFLTDANRIYNLANTNTIDGRKLHANHQLFNEVIQDFADSNYLLDFEGSDIEGIKYFYQQFGAINQPYYTLQHAKYPKMLKFAKNLFGK